MRTISISALGRAVSLLTLLLALTASARAQLTLISGSSAQGLNGGAYTLGSIFTVGAQSITLTKLGVFDAGADGLIVSHDVGIWTSGGTLLGSVTVPSGTGGELIGDFRYAVLSGPVALSTNTVYVIGALFTVGDAWSESDSNNTFASVASGYTSGFVSGGSLAIPNNQNLGSQAYLGANAVYTTAVPEPATTALPAGRGPVGLVLFRPRSVRLLR